MLRIFEIEVVNAKFFALKEELEQCDKIEEPLVIRANTGDYIELHITDTIDKEVITKCFFAGNKPDTILYQHDGIYGAIVIEEEGASFYNPHNSKSFALEHRLLYVVKMVHLFGNLFYLYIVLSKQGELIIALNLQLKDLKMTKTLPICLAHLLMATLQPRFLKLIHQMS